MVCKKWNYFLEYRVPNSKNTLENGSISGTNTFDISHSLYCISKNFKMDYYFLQKCTMVRRANTDSLIKEKYMEIISDGTLWISGRHMKLPFSRF